MLIKCLKLGLKLFCHFRGKVLLAEIQTKRSDERGGKLEEAMDCEVFAVLCAVIDGFELSKEDFVNSQLNVVPCW